MAGNKDGLDLDNQDDNVSLSEKRIEELSTKVKLTAKERDESLEAKNKAESEKLAVEKERDFFASFADTTSKYPNAKDHRDEIKSKVLAGYDLEDATVSVLAKAGKLNMTTVRDTAAGGSASTSLPASGKKSISDMSREERKAEFYASVERGEIAIS